MKYLLSILISILLFSCTSVQHPQDKFAIIAFDIVNNSSDIIAVCRSLNVKIDSTALKKYNDSTDNFMKYFRGNQLKYRIVYTKASKIDDKTEHDFMMRGDDDFFSVNLSLIADDSSQQIELKYLVCYQWCEN